MHPEQPSIPVPDSVPPEPPMGDAEPEGTPQPKPKGDGRGGIEIDLFGDDPDPDSARGGIVIQL